MEIDPATVQLSAVSMSFEDHDALHEGGHTDLADEADISARVAEMSLDDGLPETNFADQLLSALATMAMRSKRRQADLCAAICRGRLDADPKRVTEALRHLERSGCIEHLVPLYDGGVLMSVTSRGIEKLSAGPRWNMLDGAGFLRG